MSLEEAIIEIEKKDVDLRSMRPSKRFARRIVERIARQGDVSRPGYAVIPETRWLFGTKERAKKFQAQMMWEVWGYLERNKPHLLRRNTTSLLPQKKRRQLDRQTELVLREPSYIKGHNRGGTYFHFDYPRQIYCSLLYGDERNVGGGRTMVFDALKLAKDKGYPMKHVIHFSPLALREPGLSRRHDVTQGFIEEGIIWSNQEYMTDIDVDNNQYPIFIFSNRYEDGILHTATRTTRNDKNKGPAVRPIWSVGLVYMPKPNQQSKT